MATSENYLTQAVGKNVFERTTIVMQRLEDVINGAELIRQECNRIRNEFLSLGLAPDMEFTSLISHLQIDLVHLRVKAGLMQGRRGPKMDELMRLVENPMSQLSNEDPA